MDIPIELGSARESGVRLCGEADGEDGRDGGADESVEEGGQDDFMDVERERVQVELVG